MTDDRAARFEALYARLPTLVCQQKCGAFCGPICMSDAEYERIIATVGSEPTVRSLMTGLACPWVRDGRCTVYVVRPLICRLWGMVRGAMQCPHGCTPSRWLSADEAWAMIREAKTISRAASY